MAWRTLATVVDLIYFSFVSWYPWVLQFVKKNKAILTIIANSRHILVSLVFVLPAADPHCAQEWASRVFGTNLLAAFCRAAWPQCQELFMMMDHLYQVPPDHYCLQLVAVPGLCAWESNVGVLLYPISSIITLKESTFNCVKNTWLACAMAKKTTSKGRNVYSLHTTVTVVTKDHMSGEWCWPILLILTTELVLGNNSG